MKPCLKSKVVMKKTVDIDCWLLQVYTQVGTVAHLHTHICTPIYTFANLTYMLTYLTYMLTCAYTDTHIDTNTQCKEFFKRAGEMGSPEPTVLSSVSKAAAQRHCSSLFALFSLLLLHFPDHLFPWLSSLLVPSSYRHAHTLLPF